MDLRFTLYLCGMLGTARGVFPADALLWPPLRRVERRIPVTDDGVTVSQVLAALRQDPEIAEMLTPEGLAELSVERVYVRLPELFLGLREDKPLRVLCRELNLTQLELAYLFVPGGASIACEGYRFVVHSDEQVHRGTPHVHVIKNGVSVRYRLDTLERFPQDALGPEHRRDERKRIRPTLERLRPKLLALWDFNMQGYRCPDLDETGKQLYPES